MTQENTTDVGPVAPAKEPFESKINPLDLTIGEKQVFDGVSVMIGALLRFSKNTKYLDRLVKRLKDEDEGNPLTAYIGLIAFFSGELQKAVDKDPEFQAGLEAAERRVFMERMGGMIQG